MKKLIMTAIMALSITASAMAADVSQTALDTLLASQSAQLSGDILPGETVTSIFVGALEGNADIKNECVTTGTDEVSCTLWITFSPMGETALEYKVNAAGTAMQSPFVNVARGH